MKEWCLKHPWMTFFLVDAIAVNLCKVTMFLLDRRRGDIPVEKTDEASVEVNEE